MPCAYESVICQYSSLGWQLAETVRVSHFHFHQPYSVPSGIPSAIPMPYPPLVGIQGLDASRKLTLCPHVN